MRAVSRIMEAVREKSCPHLRLLVRASIFACAMAPAQFVGWVWLSVVEFVELANAERPKLAR